MSFRLLPVVVAVPVLALTIWAQAQESAPESTATSLLPEPAADKVASGVKTLKSLYASDYRRTQDSNKLQAQFGSLGLARKLLKTAEETPPDSDGYYPMLSEAARLATVGNKPDVAFDAIGRLLKTHDIDASAMRLKVLTHFGQRTTRLTDVRTASRFVMPAIQAAADAQKIKTTQALMVVGETMAKRMFDRTMQKSLAQASELLELLRKQEEDVVAALKKIEQNPEDPVANLTVARFIGLRRGDWEGAEVYAALVDEDDVRSLFVREFAAPEDIKEILRLANDWWEFAETQSGAVKLQATELAAIRYASIVKQLKGFEQKQVETRLAGVIRDHVVAVRMPVMIKAGSQQPPEWINKGLVAYYPFNGNAKDESGHGNDGRLISGASFGSDRFGIANRAIKLNGGNQRAEMKKHQFAHNAFSVCFWLKYSPIESGYGALVDIGTREFTERAMLRTRINKLERNRGGMFVILSDGKETRDNAPVGQTTNIGLTFNAWDHVAITYDGNTCVLHRRGEVEVRFPSELDVRNANGIIGVGNMDLSQPPENIQSIKGTVDDVRIYNRALSPEEVKALYEFEKAD